jgi:hypothetical protein
MWSTSRIRRRSQTLNCIEALQLPQRQGCKDMGRATDRLSTKFNFSIILVLAHMQFVQTFLHCRLLFFRTHFGNDPGSLLYSKLPTFLAMSLSHPPVDCLAWLIVYIASTTLYSWNSTACPSIPACSCSVKVREISSFQSNCLFLL